MYLILTTTPSLAQMEATHLFFHECIPLVKTIPFYFKNKPHFKPLSPPHVKCTQPSQHVPSSGGVHPSLWNVYPLLVTIIPPLHYRYPLQIKIPHPFVMNSYFDTDHPHILSVGKNSIVLIRGAHPNTISFHSLWPSSKGNRTGNHRDPFYIPISMPIPHLDTWCAISLLIRLEAKVLINNNSNNSEIDIRLWSSYGNYGIVAILHLCATC